MRSGLFYARCLALGSFLLAVAAAIWTAGAAFGGSGWLWPVVLWMGAAVYGALCVVVARGYRRLVYDLRAAERACQWVPAGISVRVISTPQLEALWAEPDENLRHSLRVLEGGGSRRLRKHGPWGWISEDGGAS